MNTLYFYFKKNSNQSLVRLQLQLLTQVIDIYSYIATKSCKMQSVVQFTLKIFIISASDV